MTLVHTRLIGLSAFLCIAFAQRASADSISADMLTFRYQELNQPWSAYDCDHELSLEPFDWNVICHVDGKLKTFWVHLAVNFYARTLYGKSGYEILYWVTNQSTKKMGKYDSTTIWIHNSQPQSLVNVFELSQGIENDFSALRLTITMKDKNVSK